MKKFFSLDQKTLFTVFVIALLIRCLFLTMEAQIWPDSRLYMGCTAALLEGRWIDFQVERTPGYPLFLALITLTAKNIPTFLTPEKFEALVANVQIFLGCLSAMLIAEIAYLLFQQRKLALWAGILTACIPNILFYEHSVLTESLFIFSLIVYVLCFLKFQLNSQAEKTPAWQLLLLGVLSGWLLWVRSIAIVVFLFTLGYYALSKNTLKSRLRRILLYSLPVMIFIGSWTAFHIRFHDYHGFAAGGGINQLYKVINLVQENSPIHHQYKHVLLSYREKYAPDKAYEAVNDAHLAIYWGEKSNQPAWKVYLEHDKISGEIAWETIGIEPLQYLMITLNEFYKLLFNGSDWDRETLVWSPVLLLGLLGMFLYARTENTSHQEKLAYYALLGMLWGQLLLYPFLTLTAPRYRLPLEPFFMVFAVYAANILLKAWLSRTGKEQEKGKLT